MRTILPLITLLAVGSAIPTSNDGWAEFKAQHGKVYSDPEEDRMRRELFLNAKAMVEEHNVKYAAGDTSYRKALNHWSDLTPSEVEAWGMGYRVPEKQKPKVYREPSGEDVPSSVDWRDRNAVTPVKNQRTCGSCYAFSATGGLEGQIAIKTGRLVSLSEQEIVDCPFDGCWGCGGGNPASVFADLSARSSLHPEDPKGLETEENYPYTGFRGSCKWNQVESAGTDVGYMAVRPSEETLEEAVANIGPISIAIYVNSNFHAYRGGIFDDPTCYGPPKHAVLVVGYGTEEGQDYWIVKNSWGYGWGEQGYIRIARNRGDMCGIAGEAVFPIV